MTHVRAAAALVALGAWAACAGVARAHPMQFGLLSFTERTPGVFDVRLRFSGSAGATDQGSVLLPPQCAPEGPRRRAPFQDGVEETFRVDCGPEGLAGEVGAGGLARATAQVLLRVERLDAPAEQHVLDERAPTVVLGAASRARSGGAAREAAGGAASDVQPLSTTFPAYFVLGVEHIAFGFDHLLFVLGLVLLVVRVRPLVATVTAFTIGHSITLALASLGVLHVPAAPVEACIALSILLLAVELARPDEPPTLTRTRPWLVAGAFGLLHGLGFAGALADVGLPEGDVLSALFAFNVGVEAGQLAFVLVILAARRAFGGVTRVEPARFRWIVPYFVGSLAAYWVFDRVASFGG